MLTDNREREIPKGHDITVDLDVTLEHLYTVSQDCGQRILKTDATEDNLALLD